MNELLETVEVQLGSSDSAISFETTGGGSWEVWDRYLTLDGKPAYHIGNICNTCNFFFERLGGANRNVAAAEVADKLASGVSSLSDDIIESWSRALPEGEYVVCLFEVNPKLVAPGSEKDYFTHEQVDLWGVDGFWGMPHQPHTEYYRIGTAPIEKESRIFQFLIPMFPQNWLEAQDVTRYTAALERGECPTAVAISVLDVKQPAVWEGEPEVTEHWCLAHYLLDGHHKVFAASQSGRSVTLLSFLAITKGIASPEQIKQALQALRQDAV